MKRFHQRPVAFADFLEALRRSAQNTVKQLLVFKERFVVETLHDMRNMTAIAEDVAAWNAGRLL